MLTWPTIMSSLYSTVSLLIRKEFYGKDYNNVCMGSTDLNCIKSKKVIVHEHGSALSRDFLR